MCKCVTANCIEDKNRICRDTMSVAWCTVMFHLTAKTFWWLVIHLTYWQERKKKSFTGVKWRNQPHEKPNRLWAKRHCVLSQVSKCAFSLQDHTVSRCYTDSCSHDIQRTHGIWHMAPGICLEGSSNAFDILGGREPVSHQQGFGLCTFRHSAH